VTGYIASSLNFCLPLDSSCMPQVLSKSEGDCPISVSIPAF
jgi:hypothetical protein